MKTKSCVPFNRPHAMIAGLVYTIAAFGADTTNPWSDDRVSPAWCAAHFSGGYDVTVAINERLATITIKKDGQTLYTFKGHEHTTFVISNTTLYYAAYNDAATGGKIIAVDIPSGAQLWATSLQGIPVAAHSRYANLIKLEGDSKQITAYGHETLGDYVEILDANTGRQLSHKTLYQRK